MRSFKAFFPVHLLVIVVFAMIIVLNVLPEDFMGLDDNPYLSVVVIQLVVYALPSVFYCSFRRSDLTPHLRIRVFKLSHLLYLIGLCIFMICGSVLIGMIMYSSLPGQFSDAAVTSSAAFAMNGRLFDGIYLLVAFAILPAVTEEFLFRGIIIGEYESMGAVTASIVSSLMFAMSHFSLARFPVYVFTGLMLAAAVYTTRSLISSCVVHTIYNSIVLFAEDGIKRIVDKQNISLVMMSLILILGLLLSGILMCFEARGLYSEYASSNTPSEYGEDRRSFIMKFAEAVLNPSFLLIVVTFILVTVFDILN